MKTKLCTRHRLNFPEEDGNFPATPEYFYRASQNKDGLRGVCKRCADLKHERKTIRHRRKHNDERDRVRAQAKPDEGFKKVMVKCYNADEGCNHETWKIIPEDVENYRWICAECKEYGTPDNRSDLMTDDGSWSDGASSERLREIHEANSGCVTYRPGDPDFDEMAKLYGG